MKTRKERRKEKKITYTNKEDIDSKEDKKQEREREIGEIECSAGEEKTNREEGRERIQKIDLRILNRRWIIRGGREEEGEEETQGMEEISED